jgi:hypothetical protein
LKQGNGAFVDENWNAYHDQWGNQLPRFIFRTAKYSRKEKYFRVSGIEDAISPDPKLAQ